ncbi:hypothetical protein P691DRAFT_768175 [Macrolepiota fuliginosa MF-IS2]|uniref:Uncharacterized protein n=1 Tax=Macrolepiota fuliginosa MF-IS2 TaxID=1400762 RepID=A0A9P5WYP5_9AGAR|nr:hypothetical protein P691DRAFT_768175 [Macrolepiota fuliginosa MF-IS2]
MATFAYSQVRLNAGSLDWVRGEWTAKPKTPGGEVEEERVGSPNGAPVRASVPALEGRGEWAKDEIYRGIEKDELMLSGGG